MSSTLSVADLLRLDELFERACDLAPDEHANFLERECGANGALRAELGRLLAGLAREDHLGRIQESLSSLEGTRIGPYRLLQRVGQGGMGEVYAAEELEPMVRRVALKLIKPGMDSVEVVARFHAERQALARMAHPNVAHVHGAGTTEGGRPYFVMEYVEGEPITAYCDRHRLGTRARIELLLDVCEGVQHAHQKGLVHRDLKPSNLLVTRHEGRPLPKVIDFGVARATTGRLGQLTLLTQPGQVLGTLEYMSPEQADPSGIRVDTRSDIYSLGVVLYELLSGCLPFGREALSSLPLSERLRLLREKDPARPSTELRSRADARAIAAKRGTPPRALLRQLAGDLDWIALRALEKDPERRYASVSELAADLRRHLAHEPVQAGPPGVAYRARKFVRRNRAAVAAGLLVTVAGAFGLAGIVSGRVRAEASERVAEALRPLADGQRVLRLEAEADALWPAHPVAIPALEAWLSRAHELADLLPGYRSQLDALRARALPWSPEERAHDRETHPDAEELASHRAELASWIEDVEGGELRERQEEEALERIAELEQRIDVLEPRVAVRRSFRFATEEDAGVHAVLGDLVAHLEELLDPERGLLSPAGVSEERGWSVPRRLAAAREEAAGLAPGGELAAAWTAALPEIRAAFPGLELSPQTGLLPLGPDPRSGLWEFAHLASGPPPTRGADGELSIPEDAGLVLVLLPGGPFQLGAQWRDASLPNYEPDNPREQDRRPDPPEMAPFFLSKFEMTQAQWERCTGTNPSLYQKGIVKHAPRNPVNQVTWSQCTTTAQRLGLVLPDEEQWEYAARGGTTSIWWTGNDPEDLKTAANLRGGADGFPAITRVGSFPANPFGLHDVLGNVTEWCSNHPYLYGTTPGTAPETLQEYAARGGNAREGPSSARSAAHKTNRREFHIPVLGLRPARGIER